MHKYITNIWKEIWKNPRWDSYFQGPLSISFQERNCFNYTEMCDPQRVPS